MGAQVCAGASALQLAATGLIFPFTVILLDMSWVKLPQELQRGDLAPALKKQSWLNMFVALGARGPQ
jgi:hypothetical protein